MSFAQSRFICQLTNKHNFLSAQFFKGKSEETFSYIRDMLQEGIDNIEKAMVRNEYKLWMYINYLLPSKRLLLTIHTITDTHLKLLDTLTDKAIKR